MEKRYVCSIFMKMLLFLMEALFLFCAILEITGDDILFIFAYILPFLLLITFDYIYLSVIMFDDKKIKIFNKVRISKFNYSNINKVQIIENARAAFLFGSTFDFIFTLKDNKVYKFHVGQILRANKLKKDMKKIFRLKCIKLEEKDYN